MGLVKDVGTDLEEKLRKARRFFRQPFGELVAPRLDVFSSWFYLHLVNMSFSWFQEERAEYFFVW